MHEAESGRRTRRTSMSATVRTVIRIWYMGLVQIGGHRVGHLAMKYATADRMLVVLGEEKTLCETMKQT